MESISSTILLLEDDLENLRLLQMILADEQYRIIPASTLVDAVKLLDTTNYQLVISDLFGQSAVKRLANANLVRDHAFPTPVGLVTAHTLAKESPDLQTFAFALQKPYNIDTLLMSIAATINQPIPEALLPEVAIIERLFAALKAHDVDSVMALCTEDVVYISQRAGRLEGKAAYRRYAEHEIRHFPRAHFELAGIYVTPTGLAARYYASWKTVMSEESVSSGIILRFQGEQIVQMGNRFQQQTL